MDLFDVILAKKMSGGSGGGGGSSDFSTAEVTIINNSSSEISNKTMTQIIPEDEEITAGFWLDGNSQLTYNCVLYKGKLNLLDIEKGGVPIADGTGIVTTGSIENLSDEYMVYIVITGNGTITIS